MATASGYSPVVAMGDGGVKVELSSDHPGFADPAYRARRDEIAALSIDHVTGGPIPKVAYSDEEHRVWEIVARELVPKHQRSACREYIGASEALALPLDHIPQLGDVTSALGSLTGFSYEPVAGLAPLRKFYGAFSSRTFFSTQYIRHHSVPLYTPEPDIVHEVIGHANQLASERFAAICEQVGDAVARCESDEALGFLSRVFWFTLEFGVVYEKGEPRAYGAGILSSFGELDVFQEAELRPFDFAAMGTCEYDITRYQPVLYAAGSFPELVDNLTEFYSSYDDEAYEHLEASATASAGALSRGGASSPG
ncbi:MAG: phenylalanine 4-monooxygenase [Acidimicrobiales bacterium]